MLKCSKWVWCLGSVQRSLRFLAGLRRIDREGESERNGSEKGRIGRKEKKVDC